MVDHRILDMFPLMAKCLLRITARPLNAMILIPTDRQWRTFLEYFSCTNHTILVSFTSRANVVQISSFILHSSLMLYIVSTRCRLNDFHLYEVITSYSHGTGTLCGAGQYTLIGVQESIEFKQVLLIPHRPRLILFDISQYALCSQDS